MSYFSYLACNRELPTGSFGLPPKAIYDNYLDYRNSDDYTQMRNFLTGEPVAMNEEHAMRMERLKGKVIVFETKSDARHLLLTPYEPIVTHQDDERFEASKEDMLKHFSLPHLYNLFCSSDTLTEYLCKYLQPGDRAEVYTCWASKEKDERTCEERTVELELFVQGEQSSDQHMNSLGNSFVIYHAPYSPQTQIPLGPNSRPDYAVIVIKEQGHESVVLHKLQEQGLM